MMYGIDKYSIDHTFRMLMSQVSPAMRGDIKKKAKLLSKTFGLGIGRGLDEHGEYIWLPAAIYPSWKRGTWS